MRTVTSTDGTRIAYERHGSDGGERPLLLLHGGGDRHFWDPIVPRFADDYTVVTPDRRGHGESGDRREYALEREVEDVRAVIEECDGEPILYGHSFGGLQAIEAARVEPVGAVVAYEPAILVGEYRERAEMAARMQARLDAGERREAMKLHLREVLFDGIEDDAFERWLDEWPAWPDVAADVETTIRMDREIERYRLTDTLNVDAPALVLSGTAGPSHLRESARAVRDALPDGHFVEFEGVGHLGPVEAVDRVTGEVRRFLREAVSAAEN